MKILKSKIDWHMKYDNAPTFSLLVDHIPKREELVYSEKDGIYYAEKDGYVSFYYYTEPGRGYGGQHYDLNMQSGEKKTLIGPWSSRSGAVNSVGFGPCLDVSLTDEERDYYNYRSAHITLDLAFIAAKLSGCQLVVELEQNSVSSNVSGEQKMAIGSNRTHNYHVIDETYPKELISNLLKNASEATFYPYLESKCVCKVCKCVMIGSRLIKNGFPCRNCATKEDWEKSCENK